MAYHYNDRRLSHEHDYNRNLARRFVRDSRHSNHPTQCIVNEGRMIVDDRTFKHSNAIIYNAPGSTLRLYSPESRPKNPFTAVERTPPPPPPPPAPAAALAPRPQNYLPPAPTSPWWWAPQAPELHTCRNCLQRRQLYYKGYCYSCAALRFNPSRQLEWRAPPDRRVSFAPETRLAKWR
ncbi:hypothetical protein GGR52DRAFT_575317 [Hypoxylon sp. FL1284]|nr:hypothetical protein GGR52DRAFT_575317 [Hypoxylon sp. FL1284]